MLFGVLPNIPKNYKRQYSQKRKQEFKIRKP